MFLLSRAMIVSVAILFAGCSGLSQIIYTQADCRMRAWHQTVDALPSPAFEARHRTGDEYGLIGIVLDETTCAPIADATVMFDMTNPEGVYDGTQTGTIQTDAFGVFWIQSDRPGAYGGGNAHVHLFVGAPGYMTITTTQDPVTDAPVDYLEILLTPDETG